MNTIELLEKVVRDRLKVACDESKSEDERKAAFDEAMKAVEQLDSLKKTESDTKDKKLGLVFKAIEIAAVPVVMTFVDYAMKMRFTKIICNFEKDYSFTTQAGRSVSQFFKFKR